MSGLGNVKEGTQRQRVFAFMSKVSAPLGLAALGFLLTRPAMTLPVGWVVILVAVIQLSVAYLPTRGSAVSRGAVPVHSMDCYRYQANSRD